MEDNVLRVVVWSTGGIGSIAVRAGRTRGPTWWGVGALAGQDRPDAGEIVGIGPLGCTRPVTPMP